MRAFSKFGFCSMCEECVCVCICGREDDDVKMVVMEGGGKCLGQGVLSDLCGRGKEKEKVSVRLLCKCTGKKTKSQGHFTFYFLADSSL